MDSLILWTGLRGLADHPPDFRRYSPDSREHLQWLGKAAALVAQWNPLEAASFAVAMNLLPNGSTRDMNVGIIFSILHRALAGLELQVPGQTGAQAFGPGAAYDFMKALKAIIGSASLTVFIVDPYLDDQVFDAYLTSVAAGVSVRLLAREYANSLKAAVAAFSKQNKTAIEIRVFTQLHDRVVMIDARECWVLGQSIKDAAQTKPTYIAPLAGDAGELKMSVYEQTWLAAVPL